MGDIADAMLDGTLCEGCGSYMGDGYGFPGYCSVQCAMDRGADLPDFLNARLNKAPPKGKNVNCPTCNKRVRARGLAEHIRVVHEMPVRARTFQEELAAAAKALLEPARDALEILTVAIDDWNTLHPDEPDEVFTDLQRRFREAIVVARAVRI